MEPMTHDLCFYCGVRRCLEDKKYCEKCMVELEGNKDVFRKNVAARIQEQIEDLEAVSRNPAKFRITKGDPSSDAEASERLIDTVTSLRERKKFLLTELGMTELEFAREIDAMRAKDVESAAVDKESEKKEDYRLGTIILQPASDYVNNSWLRKRDTSKWLRRLESTKVATVPFLNELFRLASACRNKKLSGRMNHNYTPQVGVLIDQSEFEAILEVIGSDIRRKTPGDVWTKYVAYENRVYFVHFCQGSLEI